MGSLRNDTMGSQGGKTTFSPLSKIFKRSLSVSCLGITTWYTNLHRINHHLANKTEIYLHIKPILGHSEPSLLPRLLIPTILHVKPHKPSTTRINMQSGKYRRMRRSWFVKHESGWKRREKAVSMSYRLVSITPETRSKDWPTSQPNKTGWPGFDRLRDILI